jgi:hypothetical protein
VEGYASAAAPGDELSRADLRLINAIGDVLDLLPALSPQAREQERAVHHHVARMHAVRERERERERESIRRVRVWNSSTPTSWSVAMGAHVDHCTGTHTFTIQVRTRR